MNDGIGQLVAAAERDGTAPLPALSQAELCTLGAAGKSLVCARTWDWWTGLGERERTDLAVRSLELLAVRQLIIPEDNHETGTVADPALSVILAARTRPEPVVACQVPGQDASFEPRYFGLGQPGRGPRVLVRETRTGHPAGPDGRPDFGTACRYALMTPEAAVADLAGWAWSACGPDGSRVPVIDVFGHDHAGLPYRDTLQVQRDGELADVRRQDVPAGRLDDGGLRQVLMHMLTGAGDEQH